MTTETRVRVYHEADILAARQTGKDLATRLPFSRVDLTLIATAISEVARNMISYAQGGEMTFVIVADGPRSALRVTARDSGPGIPDVELAMQDGYSTGGGLGLGLPGARRLMDEFSIESRVGVGTTIVMTKWADGR
ncbi:MAG: anti-sigma regulatory factor [Myxococcota bacterium]